jgi:hypothetical protein
LGAESSRRLKELIFFVVRSQPLAWMFKFQRRRRRCQCYYRHSKKLEFCKSCFLLAIFCRLGDFCANEVKYDGCIWWLFENCAASNDAASKYKTQTHSMRVIISLTRHKDYIYAPSHTRAARYSCWHARYFPPLKMCRRIVHWITTALQLQLQGNNFQFTNRTLWGTCCKTRQQFLLYVWTLVMLSFFPSFLPSCSQSGVLLRMREIVGRNR